MNLLNHTFLVTFEVTLLILLISCSRSINNRLDGSKSLLIKVNKPSLVIATVTPPTVPPTLPTPTVATIPKTSPMPGSVIQTGIGCGTKYMKSRDVVRIQSNGFDAISPYPPNDACTWKFIGQECTLSVECPCFDIPASFDCIEDYLKILDLPYYHQKFCGDTMPQGVYRASTEFFSLRFRSNRRNSGRGFVCFVQCTAPGQADQFTPVKNDLCQAF